MGIKGKLILSFVIGLGLTMLILIGVGEALIKIASFWTSTPYTTLVMIKWISVVIAVFVLTSGIAKYLRTNRSDVSIGFTNIPNWVYDETFEKQKDYLDKELIKENEDLKENVEKLEEYNIELLEELENKGLEMDEITYISDIFIRHHKNASRLVRSLTQLMAEGKESWKYEFCNNVLDECVTILLEDRADKSSTIYFINEKDELEMFAYNRIEFSSSRERFFKKGTGFAGHIWDTGEALLINDVVNDENYFQGEFAPVHEYGSILGVPIKIGKEVVGVLCIQSENMDDFDEDDERTVAFYAEMCGLAQFYDKMMKRSGLNANDSKDSEQSEERHTNTKSH
jgi:putative methionine-R-sulfoxide reductase with GAF domain